MLLDDLKSTYRIHPSRIGRQDLTLALGRAIVRIEDLEDVVEQASLALDLAQHELDYDKLHGLGRGDEGPLDQVLELVREARLAAAETLKV